MESRQTPMFGQLRLATPGDVSAMVPLINAAFAVETFMEAPRTDADHLPEMMQKGEFLLGYDGSGELVASVYIERRGSRGYFGMLAVAVAHQGRGFARAMVEAVEDHCRTRGCTAMDLNVLSLRGGLLPFYARLGYHETGVEPFPAAHLVKNGAACHCIVMSKELD